MSYIFVASGNKDDAFTYNVCLSVCLSVTNIFIKLNDI